MSNVNTALLSAVNDAPATADHLSIAKTLGMRSDNTRRALESHRKRGFIEQNSLSLTPEGLDLLSEGRDTPAPSKAGGATPSAIGSVDLSSVASAPSAETTTISLDLIDRSPLNYRTTFDEDAIAELADSIFQKGLLQAIGVRPKSDLTGDRYEVIFGERRWRAMRKLVEDGRWPADVKVPAVSRELDDVETLELMVTENALREDVHPLQEADAIVKLQAAREERGEASDQVTDEIADSLGKTRRWAQRRAKMAKGISPKCRNAYEAEEFTSFETAELLARYPHDVQNDCLEAITREWNPLRTVGDVKRFLDQRSMPISDALRFSLDEYEERGGTYIVDEETDEKRLAQPGLADTLTEKWVASECKSIIEKRGYTTEPIRSRSHNDWYYPKATRKLNIPLEMQLIVVEKDSRSLEVKIIHPCYDREAYERYEAKQNKKAAGEESGPKPLARAIWKLGAQARTNQLRKGIEKSPSAAMALAISSTFTHVDYDPRLCRFGIISPNGDENETGFGNMFETLCQPPLKSLRKVPPNSWDKDAVPELRCVDRAKLIEELIVRDDLVELFAARMADLCIDGNSDSRPGALAEAVALHKIGIAQEPGGAIVNPAYASKFSKDQLVAAIDAYGMHLDTDAVAGMKKATAAEAISEAFPTDKTPIEARFLSRDNAKKIEAKLLEGKNV